MIANRVDLLMRRGGGLAAFDGLKKPEERKPGRDGREEKEEGEEGEL